ncbi:kinase-like domain-containing protein [Hyaloraphidium curvatum]|nr:kinase-like domain-containing protein [Hyaloraphidium curvatum]
MEPGGPGPPAIRLSVAAALPGSALLGPPPPSASAPLEVVRRAVSDGPAAPLGAAPAGPPVPPPLRAPAMPMRRARGPASDGGADSSPQSADDSSPGTAGPDPAALQRHRSYSALGSNLAAGAPNVERAVSLTSMTPAIMQPSKHLPRALDGGSPPPSPEGGLLHVGRYLIERTVGVGTFSKVKLGRDPDTGGLVAIKTVQKKMLASEAMMASWEREIAVLRAITPHPRCISLLDTVELEDCSCLVMEYVPGGELFDWVASEQAARGSGLEEQEARRIFSEILEGVDYLHSRNVTHRDLKLENILLTSRPPQPSSLAPPAGPDAAAPEPAEPPHIKIADFGLSRFFEPGVRLTTRCGSEEYAAPEMILGQEYDPRGVDIWACGVILFAILTGQLPFQLLPNQKPKSLYSKICRADFRFPDERPPRLLARSLTDPGDPAAPQQTPPREPARISEAARDLVRKILAPNPSRRLTSQAIWQHPWLSPGDRPPNGSMASLSRTSSSYSSKSSLSRGSSAIMSPPATPTWPLSGLSTSPYPQTPVQ